MKEQEELVKQFARFKAESLKLEVMYAQKHLELDALKKSILNEALSGNM